MPRPTGRLKGGGKVYLHAVVDTFGSYAFGFLPIAAARQVVARPFQQLSARSASPDALSGPAPRAPPPGGAHPRPGRSQGPAPPVGKTENWRYGLKVAGTVRGRQARAVPACRAGPAAAGIRLDDDRSGAVHP